jgi:glycopeptide antibiotics resistance protein
MMRPLNALLFAAYLFVLIWIVLFKFSYEPLAVISDHQARSVNLVPFTRAHRSEMVLNFAAFIPFGILLGVNFKRILFWHKLAAVFAFSLAVEVVQFAFAIGVTDITDLITNTLGGFTGLVVYSAFSKNTNDRKLDRFILAAGTLVLLAVLYLRVFVFIVRY